MPWDTQEKLIVVIVLAVVMIFVVFFEMRIIRGKNKEVRKIAVKKDEAFNAILTTRSVINAMQRQGAETSEAQRLVERAKEALQRNDSETAVDICRKAREELVKPSGSRSAIASQGSAQSREGDALEEFAESILAADKATKAEVYAGSKLTPGKDGDYLCAKFEINAAKADVHKALERGVDTSPGQDLLTSAESAFVAGSYTKALSLAIRARKSVNERAGEEAIPLKRPERDEEVEPEAAVTAEEVSLNPQGNCTSCGAELDADDAFCHKCGTKVERERRCSSCGTIAKSTDAFCRKCGSRVD